MTKPFTRISSVRKATGSIYSPFALPRGSRATIKGSEGDFGKKAIGPLAGHRVAHSPGTNSPGTGAALELAKYLFQGGKRGWSRSGRPSAVGHDSLPPPPPRVSAGRLPPGQQNRALVRRTRGPAPALMGSGTGRRPLPSSPGGRCPIQAVALPSGRRRGPRAGRGAQLPRTKGAFAG